MSAQTEIQYRRDYLPPEFTIEEIDLHFTLDELHTRVIARSKVKRLTEDLATPLILDGEHLKLIRVEVDGLPVTDYKVNDQSLTLTNLPAEFILTIETEIAPANNSALEGLYRSGGAYCTQCEAQGFRRITYFLDRPDVLAVYSTTIVADKNSYPYLLSNGNEVARGELEGNLHWVTWKDPYPKPCYLFALVAGQFDLLEDQFITKSGRKVALQLFVDPGQLYRAEHAMASLKQAMAWDEQRFNLEYDLDIYMIVAVDFFNMGAMENKGLNVFNSKYVLADPLSATDQDYLNIEAVIGHEYFHNWTGNRVTCRDWFQLSLKEGLTVFRDQEFSSDLGSRTVNRIKNVRVIRGPQFAEDAGPMAHPIRPDAVMEMNNFYTVTVYNKGSEVIRMLHTLLGEQTFMQGIALYLQRFDGSAATCEDFVASMEAASGRDLTQFRLWYSQAGTPELTMSDEYDSEAREYRLTITQSCPVTAEQPEKAPFHIPVDIELLGGSGKPVGSMTGESHQLLELTKASETYVFKGVDEKPVPALLRQFSAPVKLKANYSEQQLILLLSSADDQFIRWDAWQQLVLSAVVNAVESGVPARLSEAALNGIANMLQKRETDPYFMAEMLLLSSEPELAQSFSVIDPQKVSDARRDLALQISNHLAGMLPERYQLLCDRPFGFSGEDIAHRALKNSLLFYIAPCQSELVARHYQQADNMTDSLSALQVANYFNLPCVDALMADFEQRWQSDPLVMDKWFTLSATRPAVSADEIRQLMAHNAFSLSNPNRVRALIGSFVNQNPAAFHRIDGTGYQLLEEVLITLNQTNPQVAARMIDSVVRFKNYEPKRRELMREMLERLSAMEGLSRDLYEKVSKALA